MNRNDMQKKRDQNRNTKNRNTQNSKNRNTKSQNSKNQNNRRQNNRNVTGNGTGRKRKKKSGFSLQHIIILAFVILCILAIAGKVKSRFAANAGNSAQTQSQNYNTDKKVTQIPDYTVDLLTVSEYNRPGIALDQVTGVVVHYTANPGTTAQQNRNYFEGLKDSKSTKASAHFIIGLDGEIIQCIPTTEMSYASNSRNHDTISIECCYDAEDGKFNEATYQTLVELCAWLCGKFDLQVDDIIRHYDVTGKMCPIYFVQHEDAWTQFKTDVYEYIEENGTVDQS